MSRASAAAVPVAQPASANRYQLLDECREIVARRLAEVVHEALDAMGDRLSDDAMRCGSTEQRQALLEALCLVREQRVQIESGFRRSFNHLFERRMFATRPAAAHNEDDPGPATELSLVSDDEIDERLAVERLAHRARGRLDPDEVLGIRARLGALVERDWFDENAHPASPQAVFEALKAALAQITPRNEVKSALLEAFEPHVSASLNGIYVRVNDCLKAHHVLPRIRPVPAIAPATAHAAELRPDPSARGAPPAVDASLDAMLQYLRQGQPSARVAAARMLADPEMFGAAHLPPVAADGPLIDSLSTLQPHWMPVAADAPGGAAADGGLLRQLAGHVRQQGTPLDQITVELVSVVFDYLQGDRRLPDAIRHQLLRLQLVAVKAALIDRSFFARRQHPMRRLIDRIAEIGADPDTEVGPDSPLLAGLAQAVDRIVREFDRDLLVLEQALDRIEQLAQAGTDRREQWLAARTEQAERHERLMLAREAARAQIELRVGPDTPAFARDFLVQRWTEVLAAARLDGDPPGSAWDDALRVVEDLLWSIAPKVAGEVVQLAQLLPRLIAALMRGVKRIECPDPERQAFFDELLAAHTRAIAAAKSGPPGTGRAGAAPGAPGAAESAAAARATAPALPASPGPDEALLEPLARGDRLELLDDERRAQRYKLAWISPARRLFILSRYPHEARSLHCSELAAMLERGRARTVPAESGVLDRAIRSVVRDAAPA